MINPTQCSAVLIGNIIRGSNDHGTVLRDRCDPALINNVIYDSSNGGIAEQNTCDALLINNTIVDCGRGVRFFDHTGRWGLPYGLTPGSGATLINCVIWDCDETLTLTNSPADEPGSHATLIHCNVQGGAARTNVSSQSTLTWQGEGSIDIDPMFVDAINGDFRLQEDSLLIDAGTSDQAPDVDLLGVSRPCGDGIDIGSTEYDNCEVTPAVPFQRGDTDANGSHDIADALGILFHAFDGLEIPCHKAADDNGEVGLEDAVRVLMSLFSSGDAPAAPGTTCGEDPIADELTCEAYDCS